MSETVAPASISSVGSIILTCSTLLQQLPLITLSKFKIQKTASLSFTNNGGTQDKDLGNDYCLISNNIDQGYTSDERGHADILIQYEITQTKELLVVSRDIVMKANQYYQPQHIVITVCRHSIKNKQHIMLRHSSSVNKRTVIKAKCTSRAQTS